jgi:hypothetical protein
MCFNFFEIGIKILLNYKLYVFKKKVFKTLKMKILKMYIIEGMLNMNFNLLILTNYEFITLSSKFYIKS